MTDSSERDMQRADVSNGEGDPDDLDTKRPERETADRRPADPDAAGSGVDDRDRDEVPEPNEPA